MRVRLIFVIKIQVEEKLKEMFVRGHFVLPDFVDEVTQLRVVASSIR